MHGLGLRETWLITGDFSFYFFIFVFVFVFCFFVFCFLFLERQHRHVTYDAWLTTAHVAQQAKAANGVVTHGDRI
jgi:uncharacterized membrane protein